MTLLSDRELARPSPRWVALLACAAMALAACSGDDARNGADGPTGPVGPPGPPPAGGGVPVTSAQFIRSAIVSATVPEDGKPVIEVRLENDSGQPLNGLAAANIGFVLARLEPGINGKSSAWQAITRRTEAFPGSPAPVPASAVTGTGPANQATTEPATRGTWVEGNQANGIYYYTFAQSLKGVSDISYDPSLVHRVGLEIRLQPAGATEFIPANNAVFTWTPATGGAVESGREIVDNDTCNACHDNLVFHGGARFDLQYCAMCHEPYSFDAQTGNTIDLKVMIHKIHRDKLPTGPYGIFGYDNRFHDYTDFQFTQDQRNCQTCHEESDTDTPQASNWRLTVNREACGSCHNAVNFDTGAGHGGVAATDDQCGTCHGPTSNFGVRPDQVHFDPLLRAGEKFRYEVLKVVDSGPGQRPTVTIRVDGPDQQRHAVRHQGGGRPVPDRQRLAARRRRVLHAAGLHQHGQRIGDRGDRRAGTADQHRRQGERRAGSGVPGRVQGHRHRRDSGRATGSGSAILEGRPNVRLDTNGDGVLETVAVPVVASGKTFAITDATPVAYRQVVDIDKCNDCHKQLSLHGENRTGNAELCATCHNPNATDINRRRRGVELRGCQRHPRRPDHRLQGDGARDPRGRARRLRGLRLRQHGLRLQLRAVPGQAQQLRGLSPAGHLLSARLDGCARNDVRCGAGLEPGPLDASGRRRHDACDGGVLHVSRGRGRAQPHAFGGRRWLGLGHQGREQPDAEHPARGLRHLPRPGQGRRRQESARRRRVQLQLRRT